MNYDIWYPVKGYIASTQRKKCFHPREKIGHSKKKLLAGKERIASTRTNDVFHWGDKLRPFKGRVASNKRRTVPHLEQTWFLDEQNVLPNVKKSCFNWQEKVARESFIKSANI